MDVADEAMGQVLRAIGEALVGEPVERDIQAVFEREVQRIAGMRLVRLREIPLRCHARLVTPTRTSQSIVLGVPTGDLRTQGILEVTFDAAHPPGDSHLDFLVAAAQLGGLVLESCRSRVSNTVRSSDGVAPLIGSSAVMQTLRGRLERVALTDFTVLIEGASEREEQTAVCHRFNGDRATTTRKWPVCACGE